VTRRYFITLLGGAALRAARRARAISHAAGDRLSQWRVAGRFRGDWPRRSAGACRKTGIRVIRMFSSYTGGRKGVTPLLALAADRFNSTLAVIASNQCGPGRPVEAAARPPPTTGACPIRVLGQRRVLRRSDHQPQRGCATGNVPGWYVRQPLARKCLQFLDELVMKDRAISVLLNPGFDHARLPGEIRLRRAGSGRDLHCPLRPTRARDLMPVFAKLLAERHAGEGGGRGPLVSLATSSYQSTR